jgi:hypothetical protein
MWLAIRFAQSLHPRKLIVAICNAVTNSNADTAGNFIFIIKIYFKIVAKKNSNPISLKDAPIKPIN